MPCNLLFAIIIDCTSVILFQEDHLIKACNWFESHVNYPLARMNKFDDNSSGIRLSMTTILEGKTVIQQVQGDIGTNELK